MILIEIIEKERQEIIKIVNEVLGEDTFNVTLDAVMQLANEYKVVSQRSYKKSVIIEELQAFINQKDARIEELRQEVKVLAKARNDLKLNLAESHNVDRCQNPECSICGIILCPYDTSEHCWHDGCPTCYETHVGDN